jgi:predicted DCC family thiol-disulfide oxidoreductase YuxK
MENLILFDGVCNFCDSSVNFIIKKDIKRMFRYCALEKPTGQLLVKKHRLENIDSIILIKDDKAYSKSTAILKIAKVLGGPIGLLYVFIIIPTPIRDFIYEFIAKHRYKWFGKKDQCMIPSIETRSLFIE